MALFNCHECGAEISDKAKACIRCGVPILEPEKIDDKKIEVEGEGTNLEVGKEFASQELKRRSFWSFGGAKLLLFFVIISMCLSVYSLMSIKNIPNIEQHLAAIDSLIADTNVRITRINSEIGTSEVKISNMGERLASVESFAIHKDERITMISVGIDMTEGVVTEKAVVQKATFRAIPRTTEIYGHIDIRPQPIYQDKFLGHGRFDLIDRELRSMLEEIIEEVIKYLENSFILGDKTISSIAITANNFEVALYQDGVIILAGE